MPLDAELSGDAATQPPLPQEPPPAPVEWQVLERLEKSAIGVRGPGGAATVRRTEGTVACLVRAANSDQALRRLLDNLAAQPVMP